MSGEDKNLSQTISESVEKSNAPQVATEEGISTDTSAEPKSGETTEPVYISGIDVSDIPEQDRAKLKPLLEKKAKLLEDGYQPKFQEVSKFKKAQEELISMGLDVDEARDVLLKHIEQKKNPATTTTQKKEAVKLLDKLVEQAPYDQKAPLEQMRQIILEETDVTQVKKDIADIKQYLRGVGTNMSETRRSAVEQELTSLEKEYGKEFIGKYKDSVIREGLKYPNAHTENLLFAIASPKDTKQAILTQKEHGKKPLTKEKQNAITSTPSTMTPTEKVDTKSKSLKDLIVGIASKK